MGFKARLSSFGWVVLIPLLVLNVFGLAIVGQDAWAELTQSARLEDWGPLAGQAQVDEANRALAERLAPFLILLNLAVLPVLLLTLRLKRDPHL
jgi:hypothetical protein